MHFSPFLLAQTPFEQWVVALSKTQDTPPMYGLYHLFWLGVVAVSILLVFLFKRLFSRRHDGAFRVFTLILGVSLLLFEGYKQLIYSYSADTDVWSYRWKFFPFQFCSTPIYVLPVIACLKNNRLRNALCSYLATYGFVAGLVVMLYPETVFSPSIGVNIQTMFHHGSMLVYAVYLFASKRVAPTIETVLSAFPVFFLLCAVAMAMNLAYGDGETFNMFFIAPDAMPPVPILEKMFSTLPHGVYLFSYLVFFTVASCLVTLLAHVLAPSKNRTKRKGRRHNPNATTNE